jgi:hypothetical protein
VISSSPTDAQPVFDTIARNATILTGSRFCNVFRFDGEHLHLVAYHNFSAEAVASMQPRYPCSFLFWTSKRTHIRSGLRRTRDAMHAIYYLVGVFERTTHSSSGMFHEMRARESAEGAQRLDGVAVTP